MAKEFKNAMSDSEETKSLLEGVAKGDRQAFDRLFVRHRAMLRQFVAARLNRQLHARLDASDVVQETQMEAYQRLADFLKRRPMPFKVWLCKTAYQRLLMLRRQHIKAARRAVGQEIRFPDRSSLMLARRLVPRGTSPSQHASRRDMAARVHALLAQLPEGDYEILFMRNFEGLSYEEIAGILDIDPAAARKRHGRALLKLHKLLAEDGFTESQL